MFRSKKFLTSFAELGSMRNPVTTIDGLPPSTGVNCRRLIAVSMRRTTRLLIFTLILTSLLRIYERNLNRLLFSYYRGSMLSIQLCDSLGRINTLQISTLFLTKLHDLQNDQEDSRRSSCKTLWSVSSIWHSLVPSYFFERTNYPENIEGLRPVFHDGRTSTWSGYSFMGYFTHSNHHVSCWNN